MTGESAERATGPHEKAILVPGELLPLVGLGTWQTLDLMQVHNLVDADTHIDTLAEWKAGGRVRYLGVTHYTASGAEEILDFVRRRRVEFVQINYSVDERAAERHLLPYCLQNGIAVIANRPLGGGEALRAVQGKPLPPQLDETIRLRILDAVEST